MKNLFLLMTAGLILLTGCSKEESFEPIDESAANSVYVLKQVNGTTTLEATSIDELHVGADFTYIADTGKTSNTKGYFNPPTRDTTIISWTGSESNRGTNGNAEVQISTPSYSFHFMLQTECINVAGDEAVYGGVVTQVVSRSGQSTSFDVGWRFYFKVIDYGRGSSAVSDQISNNRFFVSPMAPSFCDLSPKNAIWSYQGYTDVREPGFVNVD
jgi:hypothetical protein